jgi:aryl-alcohol dehydrogenase-like predicted oxidoreductase
MGVQLRIVPGTDLRLSEIGFGCGGNAGLMVRGEPTEQRRVVARALELGINYFDTAPDYGNGAAEEALGRVLRDIGARPLITSKVEVRRRHLGDVAGHVVRSTQESLRRLRVERLDVLQIHNGPTAAPPPIDGDDYHELWIEHFLGPGGAAEGLRRLLEAGAIRYAGFICRGDDGAAVRALLDTGLFHVINVPYTLLNPTAGMARPPSLAVDRDYGDVLGAARRRRCGAAVYSPLAGGVLAGAVAPHALARRANPATDTVCRKQILAARFRFLAETCGGSLAQMAYRFVLMHPGVSTALGGFSSLEQMEEIAAVSGLPPIPPELLAEVETVWRTPLAHDPVKRQPT